MLDMIRLFLIHNKPMVDYITLLEILKWEIMSLIGYISTTNIPLCNVQKSKLVEIFLYLHKFGLPYRRQNLSLVCLRLQNKATALIVENYQCKTSYLVFTSMYTSNICISGQDLLLVHALNNCNIITLGVARIQALYLHNRACGHYMQSIAEI